jgi:hypothetical protein
MTKRAFVTALLLTLAASCGCDDLLGQDESGVRLLLYATPRQPPTDGRHLALIGAEAVSPSSPLPQYGMCVRLTAQFGTFGSQLGGAVAPAPDGGVPSCPSARCTFVTLPPGNLRRDFAIYVSPTTPAQDILYGALFQTPDSGACPLTGGIPVTTTVLTLQVPDVPIPTADMSAAVTTSSDGGAQ